MIEGLIFSIYTVLYSVAMVFILPFEYFKRPDNLRKRWLRERSGFLISWQNKGPDKKVIWIHAVSVGEVLSSVPFIREIMRRIPSAEIVLTTVTDTGQKVASERLSDIKIIYMPFDLPFFLRRFIKTVRPSLYISIETEIWPNLFRLLRKAGIPVLIMNGRISDRSFRGYRRIGFFMKRVLNYVNLFCMQEEIYGERIRLLGAVQDKVRVTGNFKFDIKINEYNKDWIKHLKRPVIIAGSTHEGEEGLIVDVCERLRKEIGSITLIIAPRHPERFLEVEDILKEKGLRYIKRSDIKNEDIDESLNDTWIILIDVIGELASLYSVCDVSIIGGSLSKKGGHNPLEPAFWGKPIICGDDMSNFPLIIEFYERGAAIKTSANSLLNDLRDLLQNEEKKHVMGLRAREIFEKRAGAIERAVEILKGYLELPQLPS